MKANFFPLSLAEISEKLKASNWQVILPKTLVIASLNFQEKERLEKILFLLYQNLLYLFNYLDYQIKFQTDPESEENSLKKYLDLLYFNPFLWKGQPLKTLIDQWKLREKATFYRKILQLPRLEKKSLHLRSEVLLLKKALQDLGWQKLSITSLEIKKAFSTSSTKNQFSPKLAIVKPTNSENKKASAYSNRLVSSAFKPQSNKKFALSLETLESWRKKKLIELGVHSRFSSLDGVSSPSEYVKVAQEKDYQALGISDHYNVQAFPEFWQSRTPQLKLLYGCEMEMVEENLPSYLINHQKQPLSFWEKNLEDLTYCIFDLETTGFFSQYNEIIEIGYLIWKDGLVLEKKNYLVRPQQKISPATLRYSNFDLAELKKAPSLKEILDSLQAKWKNCVLVAHNAGKFDFPFLNKAWIDTFQKNLPYPVIDTLPLAWIVWPERKSYSLEKLSRATGKANTKQTHRALEDSQLLTDLFTKLLKALAEKGINQWKQVAKLAKFENFSGRGYPVKVWARNQQGLKSLYQLVTLSHTTQLFKAPLVFRSDLKKHRANLILGASGQREGEVFSLFSAFHDQEKRQKALQFYDYLEVNSPKCSRYLWLNERMTKEQLEELTKQIIQEAKLLKIPVLAGHNVHYCQFEQKILKEVLVANEGMNGVRHPLYREATLDGQEDRFAYLPEQHLRTREEIIQEWSFLQNVNLIEELVFINPQKIVKQIEEINIFPDSIQYPDFSQNAEELTKVYQKKAQELFGEKLPAIVQERMEKEWKIIRKDYLLIYWLAYQVVEKARQQGFVVGSRGSVGSSFLAYLLGITELNPLPPYYFCSGCSYFSLYSSAPKVFSCYDQLEPFFCPQCHKPLTLEGHDLPLETFFGWKGEKTPDIDLNFSGEYQKIAHDYVRQLLGEKNVYRIGTINKLSEQTAEIFWREYKKTRKELNSKLIFASNNEESWLEQLKGIKRTSGQHPGGLLIVPPSIDIHHYTPLNFPAENPNAEWLTTHFEYNFLAKIFLKLDLLGHDEPTVLQKLYQLTKVSPEQISFRDSEVMGLFQRADTLGIPEFGTDFVKKNFLKPLKPAKFSQLIQISGFSHGTNVWTQNQQNYYKAGMPLTELIACREDIWAFLATWGLDNKTAFLVSEYVRKGNWVYLKPEIKNEIGEKFGLTSQVVEEIKQNLEKQESTLRKKIVQELTSEEKKLVDLLEKIEKEI